MKLFKTAVMLTFGLTLGLLAGCSDDDGIDNRDLDYGYVQFKLYKEASYEAPQDDAAQSRAIKPQLDYLAEASKVQVTLTSGEETIVQTLTLSVADAESAEYGMRSAKLKLLTGNYTITRFTLFDAEDGELYSGAQPILQLTKINELKAYVNVPETYYPLVKKGMQVNVYSDIYPGRAFPASIEIVYPTVDPASHTFTLKLRIPNSSELIRPGMYVSTVLDLGRTEALVVPYQAVLRLIGSNNRYVFVDEGGVAKRVFVEIGERHDQTIEISSDSLKVGDPIVTTGQAKLVDGVKLNVVQ